MCDPISLGVAAFATSAVGSIASYSQASQEAAAQNQNQQRQFELQTQAWNQQEAALNRQEKLNREAASKAYISSQLQIQNEYKQNAIQADNMRLQALRQAADIQASGKSGRSIGILAMDPDREYGRDLAVLGLNLGYARDDYYQSIDSIFDQATTANAQVASQRSPTPSAPTKVRGPSSLGLIASLGGAALSAYGTYGDLKAPKGFTPPKTSPSFPSNNASLAFRIPSLI